MVMVQSSNFASLWFRCMFEIGAPCNFRTSSAHADSSYRSAATHYIYPCLVGALLLTADAVTTTDNCAFSMYFLLCPLYYNTDKLQGYAKHNWLFS